MKATLQFIIIILIGAGIILGTTFIVNIIRKPQTIEKVEIVERIINAPKCINTFSEYKELFEKGQFVILAKNKNSYALSNKFVNGFDVRVNKIGADEIACGYLYIKASIDGKKLDDNYDSIYINPNNFGGHILRTKSLNIEQIEKNKTEVLLPLNSIFYLPNMPYNPNAQNYKIANWKNLLNVGDIIDFKIGLSTLDKRGNIDEIQIVYKCWNPETGKETNDCQLSIEDNL